MSVLQKAQARPLRGYSGGQPGVCEAATAELCCCKVLIARYVYAGRQPAWCGASACRQRKLQGLCWQTWLYSPLVAYHHRGCLVSLCSGIQTSPKAFCALLHKAAVTAGRASPPCSLPPAVASYDRTVQPDLNAGTTVTLGSQDGLKPWSQHCCRCLGETDTDRQHRRCCSWEAPEYTQVAAVHASSPVRPDLPSGSVGRCRQKERLLPFTHQPEAFTSGSAAGQSHCRQVQADIHTDKTLLKSA